MVKLNDSYKGESKMLLVYCEECGQQYRFNPDRIPGRSAKVKCRTCDHVFTVTKEPVDDGSNSAMVAVVQEVPEKGSKADRQRPPVKPEDTVLKA